MSTRGVIARSDGNGGFSGTYHHWDSYPSGLGAALWEHYHGHFKRDYSRFLKVLIDDHHWSTVCGVDFDKPIGFENDEEPYPRASEHQRAPSCYCHGSRSEERWDMTDKNASESGCEYAYVFDLNKPRFRVMSSYCEDGAKMVGYFGCGDPKGTWRTIAEVDLGGDEPDWGKIGR